MTYCLDKLSPVDPDSPKLLLFLEKYVPCITRSIILKWCTTQTLSVTEQLDTGIRYLDLRIAHRPDVSSNLYFVHGFYTSQTVEEILHEIADWLQQNPREILILGCDNLQSMSPEHHMCLINFIHRIFGPKICPKHERPTLRNLWKQSYQLIVCYDSPLALKFEYLWPSIPYWWANTTKTRSLINFLEMKKHSGRPGIWLFICIFTLIANCLITCLSGVLYNIVYLKRNWKDHQASSNLSKHLLICLD